MTKSEYETDYCKIKALVGGVEQEVVLDGARIDNVFDFISSRISMEQPNADDMLDIVGECSHVYSGTMHFHKGDWYLNDFTSPMDERAAHELLVGIGVSCIIRQGAMPFLIAVMENARGRHTTLKSIYAVIRAASHVLNTVGE